MERLRRSDAFEAEIQQLLGAKGHPPTIVEAVLAVLRQRRLLDDARVVEAVLSKRSGKRARGPRALRQELLSRGAPAEEVDRRLAQVGGDVLRGQMLELLAKTCKTSDSRLKGARLLISRGYDEDEVVTALDEFFGPSGAWDEA